MIHRRLAVVFACCVLLLLLTIAIASMPQQAAQPFRSIQYRLAMSQPASHLFEVSIDVEAPAGPAPTSVDFQMPRWQPGRYSIADYAANVQEVSVKATGQTLPVHKVDDQTWRVDTRGSRAFSVSYKVFGNDLSGSFAQLDTTHANYTGGEIFMYLAGHKQDPVGLEVVPPSGWRVINGRSERPNQTAWKYPNYETLIDNPTEIGPDWTLDEFAAGGKTYRVVVHSRANEGGMRPNLVRDLQKIVAAETRMWGTSDFDNYTFMIHFAADGVSHDGMEHLTSTQIIRPGALADPDNYKQAVSTAAHEFFHAWNVKRLRPAELGPWEWTRPASTESLWIAEGLTQYYGVLTMRRAGLWNDAQLLDDITDTIANVENEPGNRLMSAVDASLAAPFIDGAMHRQHTNLDNTTVSYYTKGELIGLVLDLTLRTRTTGRRSLDDVLKQMYEEFYLKAPNASYYLRGRGYTQADFVRVLSGVAATDMSGFYERYIRGIDLLPYVMCGNAGTATVDSVPSAVDTASTSVLSSSRSTPRSITTRSMPACWRRRASPASVSAFVIGMSSTTIWSATMPIVVLGASVCSSWMAVESDSRFRAMMGWPLEYSCADRSAAAKRRSNSSAS